MAADLGPMSAPGAQLPGLDLTRLGAELDRFRPGLLRPPLYGVVIPGGKSNLTFMISDAEGARRVLRRPPLGHVLATAHDMSRECRVLEALAGTAVPVPRVDIHCDDPDVIGAPFYVMEAVPGTPYRLADELRPLGAERTATLVQRMVETLAELHAIDPAAVGLADFGRPSGFLQRQVQRWKKQLDASHSRDLPGLDELYQRLSERVPTESGGSIIHGDFRLDNLLVDGGDRVTAVLDWEMATLGDPLTDIALLMAYTAVAGDADAPSAEGFPTPNELLGVYRSSSGRSVGSIGFYLALSYFKMIGIREGIHYRYVHGQTVGEGFDRIGERVPDLIWAALDALKEDN